MSGTALLAGFTIDRHIQKVHRPYSPGGPAYYCSLSTIFTGCRIQLYSVVGRDFQTDWLNDLASIGVNISQVKRNTIVDTTAFAISYDRRHRVLKMSHPMNKTEYFRSLQLGCEQVFTSFTHEELDVNVLYQMTENRRCGIDIQGYCRKILADGTVTPRKPGLKPEKFNVVKLSAEDVPAPVEYARRAVAHGTEEVVVTLGSSGSRVFTSEYEYVLKPPSIRAVHPTGAGDIFVSTYFNMRGTGYTIADSLAVATSTARALISARILPSGLASGSLDNPEVEILRSKVSKAHVG